MKKFIKKFFGHWLLWAILGFSSMVVVLSNSNVYLVGIFLVIEAICFITMVFRIRAIALDKIRSSFNE